MRYRIWWWKKALFVKAGPTRKRPSNSAENGRELESTCLQKLCESSPVLGLAEGAQEMLVQVTSRIQKT